MIHIHVLDIGSMEEKNYHYNILLLRVVFYNSRNFLRLNIDKESEVNGPYELNNEISTQKRIGGGIRTRYCKEN